MESYLASSEYVDWQHPDVLQKAKLLARDLESDEGIARACFLFVRDEIKHSWDHRLDPVTLKASDVLKHGTGYCYAKSHLLAALLRANAIPAALCYQRLTIEDDRAPFCLHGLNAVYLKQFGWYRIDARGNKPGVQAEFCPPKEQLAFLVRVEGEADLPGRFSRPMDLVIQSLRQAKNYQQVADNLPDIARASE